MKRSRLLFVAAIAVLAAGLTAFLSVGKGDAGLASTGAQQAGFSACPSAGGWATAVWTGADYTPVGQAVATCTGVQIDAVFWFNTANQLWRFFFASAPAGVNTLSALNNGQVVFLHGRASAAPTPTPAPTATPAPAWLARLNAYRGVAYLSPASENPTWSEGCRNHARYMVKNDVLQHSEEPSNPWYTSQGDDCARAANIMTSAMTSFGDEEAIDLWMRGPFHALGIIDPALAQVGYGSYREADGGQQMGAALDVIRGLGAVPPPSAFPIAWPGDGATMPLLAYDGSELPNPLTGCPGYVAPSGPPIILQLGDGSMTPIVTAHSFLRDGTPLEHCVFDETSYTHPDSGEQEVGRSVLGIRDAIVLMPRAPLVAGTRYTVSITVSGRTHTWSFTASEAFR